MVVRTVGVLVKGPTKVIDPFRIKMDHPNLPKLPSNFWQNKPFEFLEFLWWLKPCTSWYIIVYLIFTGVFWSWLVETFQPSTLGYLFWIPTHTAEAGSFPDGHLQEGYACVGVLGLFLGEFLLTLKKVSMLLGWILSLVNPATWSFPQKIPCWGLKIPWPWSLDLVQSRFQKQRLPPNLRGREKGIKGRMLILTVPHLQQQSQRRGLPSHLGVAKPKLGWHDLVSFVCRTSSSIGCLSDSWGGKTLDSK